MKLLFSRFFGLLTLFMLPFGTVSAHPHYFVQVQWQFTLDEQGKLTGMSQQWVFDEMVSAVLIGDMVSIVPGQPAQSELDAESRRLDRDLSAYDYYSHLKIGQQEIPIPIPTRHQLQVVDPISDNPAATPLLQWSLEFTFPQPISSIGQAIEASIFDPTYYAAVQVIKPENLAVNAPQSIACSTQLVAPNPDAAMVAYAFSLDQSQRNSHGLGEHFAEKITIECQRGAGEP